MSADAWFTLAVVVVTIALMVSERVQPSVVMLSAVIVLMVGETIDEAQAFSGFSNAAPITVAALYVLAGATETTGALQGLTERILGGRRRGPSGSGGDRQDLARVVVPGALASGLIANTPLVSMVAPRIVAWARRTDRSPSRFLMPFSFAAVFGGVITVIGTSTNVTVSGLLTESGRVPLDVFEITPVGLPIALIGVLALVLLTPILLPRRRSPGEIDEGGEREYTVEMLVEPSSPLVGRTITDAGLRNLVGVYLVEIERDGRHLGPVAPDEVLVDGDRLMFAGNIGRVLDLQKLAGLVPAGQQHFSLSENAGATFEVVVAEGSPLIGSTLKEVDFRARYGAAVIAIHRSAERLVAKLGEVRLRPGDLMLVLGDPDFARRWRGRDDFLLVSAVEGGAPLRRNRARAVELITLALIVVSGAGVLSLLKTSLLAALACLAVGAITPGEARRAVNFDIVVLIAASFGLGAAMQESGLAAEIARGLVDLTTPLGDIGVLAGVLLATMILTELLSNNAAAVLMFPVALATAAGSGLAFRPFVLAIIIGASCSFLTPIGYQTNLLVFGMGGYKFRDFTRLGAPLTLVTFVASLVLIPIAFPLR
ncbi:MAG TPA: SLC13 family permease [Acidimicrobiia bacterium]|nr:SLC13 family permease [Acidimicrobiia bacterium]